MRLVFASHRDVNLWRPNIGRLYFFTTPPPPNFNKPLPPKKNLTQPPIPKGNDLGHYMTSYMTYIKSKFEIIVLMLEIIFVNDKIVIRAEMPQKPYCE